MCPLPSLGWGDDFEAQRAALGRPVVPGRVSFASHGVYEVKTEHGERRATCSGRLLHTTRDPAALPAVGDWVGLRDGAEQASIVHMFTRRTALVRKNPGRRTKAQVLVANVDTVFVVSALNAELNVRRIERFLATVLDGGAAPVLVLNKLDLCPDPTPFLDEVRAIAPTLPIVLTSATRGDGADALRGYARDGATIALVGASGVGKSALTNALLGRAAQREQPARRDDRGRHTTAHRELFLLPGGGLLVDTPGLRELGLWSADDERPAPAGFDDVDALATRCRYRDCRHAAEPGCAVRAAADAGVLAPERLHAWQKLEAEQRALRARSDVHDAIAEKHRRKAISRSLRKFYKG